jgi:hypothetical protein
MIDYFRHGPLFSFNWRKHRYANHHSHSPIKWSTTYNLTGKREEAESVWHDELHYSGINSDKKGWFPTRNMFKTLLTCSNSIDQDVWRGVLFMFSRVKIPLTCFISFWKKQMSTMCCLANPFFIKRGKMSFCCGC